MQKQKLERFIQKYSLNGNVNMVKWKFGDKNLSTNFITADKSLLGNLKLSNFDFKDAEIGIGDTSQLSRLFGVLKDDVELSLTDIGDRYSSLNLLNGTTSVNYVLSDLSVIPEPPKLKHKPDFNIKIKVDSTFINTFIKGKSALSEIDSFTVVNKNNKLQCIIGYSSINTNRVNISVNVEGDYELSKPISFNANLFKDILVANKECDSALLEVSDEGLARINFKVDDYDVTYYLVAMS
tara:strand:+ start:239 stop:952 length:714 start_codon:yes stop_codon:yes gene_type:complete